MLFRSWLYNYFAGRFFGVRNDQDLRRCALGLRDEGMLPGARFVLTRTQVQFFAPDFEQFMRVVWMILLHPTVHRFSRDQQCAVIDYVYDHLWSRGLPLLQEQDHVVIYRTGDRGVTPKTASRKTR